MHSSEIDEVFGAFEQKLNRHGYGFQYAVLKEAQEAFNTRRTSQWRFLAAEVPVQAQSRDTRIDFILSRHRDNSALHWYLVCECKRVNPARSHWCFVRSPFVHKKRHGEYQSLLIECVEPDGGGSGEYQASAHPGNMVPCYGLGLAVKSRREGESGGSDDDAIERTASQVLLGVNGFTNTLGSAPFILGQHDGIPARALLIPVIFTTATLWVSDIDLAGANIEDGKLDLASSEFRRVPWVWFSYHTSSGLRHSLPRRTFPTALSQLMDDDHIRHIAVVSGSGIEPFLRWSSDNDSLLS